MREGGDEEVGFEGDRPSPPMGAELKGRGLVRLEPGAEEVGGGAIGEGPWFIEEIPLGREADNPPCEGPDEGGGGPIGIFDRADAGDKCERFCCC